MAEPESPSAVGSAKTFREKYGANDLELQDLDAAPDYQVKPGGWQIIKPGTLASQEYRTATVLKPIAQARRPPAIKLAEPEEQTNDVMQSPPVTPVPRTPTSAMNSPSNWVPDSPSSVASGASSMTSLPPPPEGGAKRPLILIKGRAVNRTAARGAFESELGFVLRKVQGYVSMGMVVAKKNWMGAQKVYVAAEFESEQHSGAAKGMLTGQIVAGYKLNVVPYSNMDDDDKE